MNMIWFYIPLWQFIYQNGACGLWPRLLEKSWHCSLWEYGDPVLSELHLLPFHLPGRFSQGSTNATVLDVAQTGGHKSWVRRSSSFSMPKSCYMKMPRWLAKWSSTCPIWSLEYWHSESLQTPSSQCEPATNTREFLLKVAAGPVGMQIGFLCQHSRAACRGMWHPETRQPSCHYSTQRSLAWACV